jgi:hypothetical protein
VSFSPPTKILNELVVPQRIQKTGNPKPQRKLQDEKMDDHLLLKPRGLFVNWLFVAHLSQYYLDVSDTDRLNF